MLTLALDTSSLSGSLAVLKNDSLLGVISTRSDENYSSRMFRHLDFLLSDLSLHLRDFDLFSVAAGPGSFTGLRIGLTAAKAWSEVYNKPVVGVSALEAVAIQSFRVADSTNKSLFVPVLDARRGQIYSAFYRADRSRLILEGDQAVMTCEELLSALQKQTSDACVVISTPEPQLISDALSRFENSVPSNSRPSLALQVVSSVLAPSIGSLGFASAQRGEFSNALTLDANYVRRSDAELQLKGN
ncbi:MAG TPA: tRNA (adenosine(37)-N6)-threonylcarbamoyltransferase complex dimerization subunit type 1 TsaB [Candidatus Acidoferrales bacterium]